MSGQLFLNGLMATEFGINESFGTSDDGCTTL